MPSFLKWLFDEVRGHHGPAYYYNHPEARAAAINAYAKKHGGADYDKKYPLPDPTNPCDTFGG